MRSTSLLAALGLGVLTVGILGGHPAAAKKSPAAPALVAKQEAKMAPDFPATLEWLNTDKPLSFKDLRGKVVLLDFWTYCCINCMHIIPDLKKLEAKYPNELVVVGVHSAKFKNEKDSENIRSAILRYELEHPVINDKDFLVWNAYGANSWPTLALIAPDGTFVGGVSGEGHYAVLDQTIAKLITVYDAKGLLNRKPMHFVLEKDNKPKSVLSYPGKIVADAKGNRLFFTDSNHNRIVIASLKGEIQEVIGEGNIGLEDGTYSTAQFFRPQGLALDAEKNLLYVADTENHAIRKIDLTAKTVKTLAGDGVQQKNYPPLGGIGKRAELSSPWDLYLNGKLLYIAMAGTHQLWTLNLTTLEAAPYAGTAGENIKDGPLRDAQLAQPSGITSDGKRLYFADSEVSAVRSASLGGTGEVKTIIGMGLFEFGDVDGNYPTARLQHPIGIAYHDDFLYVADTYNHKIKRVSPNARRVETFLGTGQRGMTDGAPNEASLNEPNGLAFAGDKLYITDTNNGLIRVFDLTAKKLSTLKLTGLDKLAQKSHPAFIGKETTLPMQEISADAKTLEITIELPAGTKFNKEAPFRIQATSEKPGAVEIGAFSIKDAAHRLSIPITPKAGETQITVEMSINYCAEGNAGLCYFKEARLKIPVKVTPNGSPTVLINYTL